jgi:hypothetical protein
MERGSGGEVRSSTLAWILLPLLLTFATPYSLAGEAAGSLEQRFQAALKDAWAGRPQAARDTLTTLWEQYGVRRPTLAYDLGVLALTSGEPARAVHWFRLAEGLGPSADLAEEITQGLAQARKRLVASAERDVHRQHLVYGDVTGLAHAALHRVPEAALAWGTVGLTALLVGVFAWKRGRAGTGARVALAALTVMTVLAAGSWAARVHQDATTALGVVVSDDATLREALDPAAPTHAVPGGTEVLLLEQPDGDHVRVKLPTGRKGWMAKDAIGTL